MKKYNLKAILFLFSTIGLTGIAQAAATTYEFTAFAFETYSGNYVPPAWVTGSFTLDGSAVTQINLTIGTYTYSTGDVAFDSAYPAIGAKISSIHGLASGTNDFELTAAYPAWAPFDDTQAIFTFLYTIPGSVEIYYTNNVRIKAFPAAVPIPASISLFGSALIGLIGAIRKKKAV